jgi:hypothetical protein
MYHDRTAWRCAFFVGKKYGSKGYPQGNAAHMGSISLWHCFPHLIQKPSSQLGFVTYLLNRPRTLLNTAQPDEVKKSRDQNMKYSNFCNCPLRPPPPVT